MMIKIELKTSMVNDPLNRIPSLEKIQSAMADYAQGFKGLVVLHESLYDYRYDTKTASYTRVDSNQVIGNIRNTEINNHKLYLIIDVNDSFIKNRRTVLDKHLICFFRSNMQSVPGSKSVTFDKLNIFAVDIIVVGDNETVTEDYLSEIVILEL